MTDPCRPSAMSLSELIDSYQEVFNRQIIAAYESDQMSQEAFKDFAGVECTAISEEEAYEHYEGLFASLAEYHSERLQERIIKGSAFIESLSSSDPRKEAAMLKYESLCERMEAYKRDCAAKRATSHESNSPTSENSKRGTYRDNRATSSVLESEANPNMNLATSPALNPQTSAPFEAQSANRTTSSVLNRTTLAENQEADSTNRTLMFNSNVATSQHPNTSTSSHLNTSSVSYLEDITTSLQADAMSHPAKLSMLAKVATSPLMEIADLQQRIFKAADILDAMSPDDPDLTEYTKIYQALWDRLRELEQGGTDHA